MIVLRGLFWLALVAYLVPYKTFDLPKGRFVIDEKALMASLRDLPHYCAHNARACRAADALVQTIAVESRAAAQAFPGVVKAHKLDI